MKTVAKALLFSLIIVFGMVSVAGASQQPGHIYIALTAMDYLPPGTGKLLIDNLDSYIAGATGPDIGLLAYALREKMEVPHPGAYPHYQKTGQLIKNMLNRSQNGPETAFGLGWLTHYHVDCTIHPLVNAFGGYYTGAGALPGAKERHVTLELFEAKHVMHTYVRPAQYGFAGSIGRYAINSGAVPVELIEKAFYDTYVDRPFSLNRVWFRFPFSLRGSLARGAMLMAAGTGFFARQEAGTAGDGLGQKVTDGAVGWVLGNVPTTGEYEKLMEPLKITGVSISRGEKKEDPHLLQVYYRVNDLRLLKPFADAWDQTYMGAVERIISSFTLYAADPAGFSLMDANLDTGLAEKMAYPAKEAFPGNPEIKNLLVKCRVIDVKGMDVSAWPTDGQWVNLSPLTEKVWGGTAGDGVFVIPLNTEDPGPFRVELSVEFARAADKKPYGVKDEWGGMVEVSGEEEEESEEGLLDGTWKGNIRFTQAFESSGLTEQQRREVVGQTSSLEIIIRKDSNDNYIFHNPALNYTWTVKVQGRNFHSYLEAAIPDPKFKETLYDSFEGTVNEEWTTITGKGENGVLSKGPAYAYTLTLEKSR
jgi:hypothetical protein